MTLQRTTSGGLLMLASGALMRQCCCVTPAPCNCPGGLAPAYIIDFNWAHRGCNGSIVRQCTGPVLTNVGFPEGCSWSASPTCNGISLMVTLSLDRTYCCWRIWISDMMGGSSGHTKTTGATPVGAYSDYAFSDCPWAWRDLSVTGVRVSNV